MKNLFDAVIGRIGGRKVQKVIDSMDENRKCVQYADLDSHCFIAISRVHEVRKTARVVHDFVTAFVQQKSFRFRDIDAY